MCVCSFLIVHVSVSDDVVVILHPFRLYDRMCGMRVSCIAAMCILLMFSCCVMSNCVSIPAHLSGLIDVILIDCAPSLCPSIVSIYPLLKIILRFCFLYVLFLVCACFCSFWSLVLGSWSFGVFCLLPLPPCGLWLDVVSGLSRLYGVADWVEVAVFFCFVAGRCSLVFWGGGDGFGRAVEGYMF